MNAKQICGLISALVLAASAAGADSLELKNGSPIKGKFMGGSQTSIRSRNAFGIWNTLREFIGDVESFKFGRYPRRLWRYVTAGRCPYVNPNWDAHSGARSSRIAKDVQSTFVAGLTARRLQRSIRWTKSGQN